MSAFVTQLFILDSSVHPYIFFLQKETVEAAEGSAIRSQRARVRAPHAGIKAARRRALQLFPRDCTDRFYHVTHHSSF